MFYSVGLCEYMLTLVWGFPGGAVVRSPPAKQEGSVPGSGRFPGVGNGNPLQDSCLGIPGTEEPSRLQSMEFQRVGHD